MTATVTPQVTNAPAGTAAHGRQLFSPWRIVAIATVVVLAIRSVHPVFDIDLYWHIPLGNQIVATHSVTHAGDTFAYTLPGKHWITTQWLSEVTLATIYDLGGFAAIGIMRVLLSIALMGCLGWQLLRGRRTMWGPVVFAAAAYISSSYFQERPQLFSLFFVVWLAGVMRDEVAGNRPVRWWPVVVLTWLWANVHGLWVMVPACYVLVAVGRLVQRGDGAKRSAGRAAALALATAAAATLTPVGPKLLATPLAFAQATKQIQEWQPTNFHNGVTIALAVLVAAIVMAWVRSSSRIPATELVYVGGLTAFALFSMRDVPPAAILLAPVVLQRLEATLPRADRSDSAREKRIMTAASVFLLGAGLLATVAQIQRTPALPSTVPNELAERISASPGVHRVLDDYNASGAVIFWGGSRTQVAVDGRADRYGAHYIADYSKLMLTTGNWAQELAQLAPNYALLDGRAPLVRELEEEGWTVTGSQGKWVLLQARDSTR